MTVDAARQLDSTPFTGTTVNTTGAVFGMAGIDTFAAPAANEVSAVGQLQIASQTVGTLGWDSNDNGATPSIPTLPGQTVAFDPTTGCGTIAVAGGTTDGLADELVFYLSSSGNGFILDGTSNTTNRAMAGTLTAQTGSPFSTTTDFANLSIVRAKGSSVNDAQTYVGVLGPGGTSAPYLFVTDDRAPTNTGIQTQTGVNIGLAANLSSATTGRGTLVTGAGETLVFYVIGPSQFIFVNTTQVEGSSPLFFATPQ